MNASIHIRFADENDVCAIAMVHVQSWQKVYRGHIPDSVLHNLSVNESRAKWSRLIQSNIKLLVLELDKIIVGFASIQSERDRDTDNNKCGEISAIYFHPDVWRQELGSRLCNRAIFELKGMGFSEVAVWVLTENVKARKFYEHLGFVDTGDIKSDMYLSIVMLNSKRYHISI